jgi:uncharacterized membrane protein YdjX (TVP38/TMEM64 family)
MERSPGETLVRVLAVVILLLALVAAVRAGLVDPVAVRDFILSFGRLAPLVWIALYLGAVFVPYATTVMTIAAGLAFGTVWGGLLTYGVTIFASLLPFTVSRHLGREWVEWRVGGTKVKRWADLINRNAFLVFFYLRLVPSIPYELQNHIAGVTRIRHREFFLASALGNGPVLFIMAFLGDSLSDPGSPRFWLAAAIFLAALLAPLAVAWVRSRLGKPPLFGQAEG